MRSDRWMITVRVWWLCHSNLILRYPENMKNQYNINKLQYRQRDTVDIEYTILTYPA